LVKLDKG